MLWNPLWRRAATKPAPGAVTPPLRYALIGAGSAARSHLRDIGGRPGVTVVGIADPAPPQSWRISGDYGKVPHFTDAAQLLQELKPDLVSICTPTKFHRELVLVALGHGAHVVCEKPLAMTLVEAEEMEVALTASGKLGAVNFSCRNITAFRAARDVILSGRLGRITRVNVAYLQGYLGAPGAPWSWRSDIELAGFGALGDLGVHMIDSVRFMTGLDFRRVVAHMQTQVDKRKDGRGQPRTVTTDSNAAFLAELSGGVLATFEISQVAAGYADFFRLEISGECGTLIVNREQPNGIHLQFGTGSRGTTQIPFRKISSKFAARGEPTSPGAIVHAIRGTKVQFPCFKDAVAAQRVLSALVSSMRSCGWTAIEDPSSRVSAS